MIKYGTGLAKEGESPITNDEWRNASGVTAWKHAEVLNNWWRGIRILGKRMDDVRTVNFFSDKVAYCEANKSDDAAWKQRDQNFVGAGKGKLA